VPAPAHGESYYAWLLSDESQSPMTSVLLGAVSVDHGYVHFHYPGDQQHTNLISVTSRLLITEESASSIPKQPSSDQGRWRYYAELPQKPSRLGRQEPAALDCLRALLYRAKSLQGVGIQGGLNIQLLKIQEKCSNGSIAPETVGTAGIPGLSIVKSCARWTISTEQEQFN